MELVDTEKSEPGSRAISRISVTRLFGQFDYILSSEPTTPSLSHANILILYGDNGSGKTTILKLLFHLLSPSNNRGPLVSGKVLYGNR